MFSVGCQAFGALGNNRVGDTCRPMLVNLPRNVSDIQKV
ncbi:MAG: hypothetical protein EZS28_035950, partial [Streblomastix strix]